MADDDDLDEDRRVLENHEGLPRESRRGSRIRRLGRRIIGDIEEELRPEPREPREDRAAEARPERAPREPRSILGDAKDVLGAVLEGSDKAKTEVVRAVAREVRHYLEELGLKDDIHNLLTNYSLEVHASVNLKRLVGATPPPDERAARRRDVEEE